MQEFAALSAHYNEAQIFEIILLCGFYRTVSYLANGLALPLEAKRQVSGGGRELVPLAYDGLRAA